MGEPILAIDYGTFRASAAYVVDGRVELVRETASGVVSWPASVFADNENLIVGTLAERRKRIWPAAYRGEVKRDLRREAPVSLDGHTYAPARLVTATLAALKAEAEAQLGDTLPRAVITIPAVYDPTGPLRRLMINAAEAAGFVDVDLLAEPVAAAWAPLGANRPHPGDLILVYDLGGGTFDAALIAIGSSGRHEVIGHSSLYDCGGRDLDQLLFDEILSVHGPGLEPLLNPTGPGEVFQTAARRTRHELVDFARALKHQLTDVPMVEDVFGPAGLLVGIDRERFVQLASPTLARTMACCQHLLDAADVPADKLGGVLLVGGGSKMPVVADILAGRLGVATDWPGQQLFVPPDPELAVVRGAAAWAASVSTRRTVAARPSPVVQPARWEIPGGTATMVRWLAEPGARFEAGTVLARVRLSDGSLFDLAAEAPGSLLHTHAPPGMSITEHDWIATTLPTSPVPLGQARAGTVGGSDLRGGVERAQRPSRHVEVSLRATLTGHDRDVTSCAFSPDGRLLATISKDGIKLWDVTTGRVVDELSAAGRKSSVPNSCVFSPDGKLLAITGSDKTLRIFDVVTRAETMTFSGHKGPVYGVAFSPDGTMLATTSTDRTVKLWGVATGNQIATLTGEHRGSIYGCAFSPDGRLLVSAGAEAIYLWDVAVGESIMKLAGHTNFANGCAFSPDGLLLATTSNDGTRVTDVPTGTTTMTLGGSAQSCAFSPDGQLLATASTDDVARLWDVSTGVEVDTLSGHSGTVMSCAFAPFGLLLATTSTDTTARLWEIIYVR
ncbi:Hsp70 family protein [Frankia sp. CNm7]|uniref:Hsp70 family protein n=1 Tax=Frankia nepalensis TaxID=1836974 RepID=A0A937RI61_9ACTN|nr:Hsp70 family protein [Frankia nepalensis]MBL7497065.1 Hsp70 family protein [Frankia nepalensis]MBL7513606.1 Hsp70 family protein [Frankia nepalensis]MBL7522824.1 Hsp70 family protein [Frankia nepalensis]MBL7626456.1 Hsp70 family protein [Frankia nepalensis]